MAGLLAVRKKNASITTLSTNTGLRERIEPPPKL